MIAVVDARSFLEVLLVLILVGVLLQQLRSVFLVEIIVLILFSLTGHHNKPHQFGFGYSLQPGEEGDSSDRPKGSSRSKGAYSIEEEGVSGDVGQPYLSHLRSIKTEDLLWR